MDIVMQRGGLSRAGQIFNTDRKILVLTDSGVPAGYARAVASSCPDARILTIPSGETSKNLDTLSVILSALKKDNFTRKDAIIAVGGGMVGDISGFAASCYMRGIEYYNVPTTLLSQVDSSVGGKTAVNFEGVKNLIGAFHNPSKVLIDAETLESLSPRQFSEGVAEMIKMAASSSPALFEKLDQYEGLRSGFGPMISEALDIKMSVVEKDPFESGLRKVLNFGHTIGHAIEAASEGKLYHGECVAIGMLYMCSPEVTQRIRALLEKYDLPVKDDIPADKLCELISHDKKCDGTDTTVVWVEEIGKFEFRTLTPGQIRELIENHKSHI